MQLSVLLRLSIHRCDDSLVKLVISHLRPSLDNDNACLLLQDDAIGFLQAIDALEYRWPLQIASDATVSKRRREELASLEKQAAQLGRAMAGVGVLPAQLASIDQSALDAPAQAELSLVTREAAWQLRSLARLARRRWQLGPDETLPDELRQWLDDVDGVFARVAQHEVKDGHEAG
ncbi:MAG: hypothetical protein LH632_23520 [Rhodoferax sp.]|nr:hypothetical protein [Rhodoferax sp.]